MIPDPLHPAVVHFPIVLMFLLPLVALAALWRIRRGAAPRAAWSLASGTAAALAFSAWVAVQTGEAQEERVEEVVTEGAMHTHEEAAERFLLLSGAVFVVAAAGLLGGRVGQGARLAATAGAVGLVAAGALVGHSGGELVYRHGAASAYTQPASGGVAASAGEARPEREAEDD